MQVKTIFSLNS